MATALEVIKRSLRLDGVYAPGENLASADANDAFTALNAMVDAWNNESLMIFNLELVTHTLVSGQLSYTIGSGGDIDVTRPQRIETAYINDGNTDWPMIVIKDEQYARIWDKTTQSSYPQYIYYRSSYPLGEIILWPSPDSTHTLNLSVWNQLTQFTNINTELSFPPGYLNALTYGLAVDIAPEYGKEASPTVQARAVKYMSYIKRINQKNIPVLRSPMRFIEDNRGYYGSLRGLFNA